MGCALNRGKSPRRYRFRGYTNPLDKCPWKVAIRQKFGLLGLFYRRVAKIGRANRISVEFVETVYASTAICILVAADEAYCVHFGGCAIALCLFVIGLATAYLSTRLIMRGPGAFAELRGRIANMVILNLLIHGAVLIAFLALAMGQFDDVHCDMYGIKGLTFRTSDPLAYEEVLARAGWKELLRIDRGPPPFYPIAHLSFTQGSGGNVHLNCRMTVDRQLGIIDFDAAAN